jgi:hypothetical protein
MPESSLIEVKLNPRHAAESSSFNIHQEEPPQPSVRVYQGAPAARARKFGTVSDIAGGS